MISVEEALAQVIQHRLQPPTEQVSLLSSPGRVLAQDVTADRDFPPFDRVTMDGVAILSESFQKGTRSFKVEGIQAAGQPQTLLINPDNCVEIMTGAVLPENTDAVVPYEQCHLEDGVAQVQANNVQAWQNVHLQGSDGKAGDLLLTKGMTITPALVGIMASVGMPQVPVLRLPSIAVCSTGDELIDLTDKPLPHQIRKSNVYVLTAALQAEGVTASSFHLPDEPDEMTAQLSHLADHFDVVLLSGAVSKGKFDFLPTILQKLGMQKIFHGIAQKPGKPFLFGSMPNGCKIFGFPGNPVSGWVCYQVYFLPWLAASFGKTIPRLKAQLTQEIQFAPALTNHLLVSLQPAEGILKATPIQGSGSGDLTSLISADGLLSLPAHQEIFKVGEFYDVIQFRCF